MLLNFIVEQTPEKPTTPLNTVPATTQRFSVTPIKVQDAPEKSTVPTNNPAASNGETSTAKNQNNARQNNKSRPSRQPSQPDKIKV